jgi:hypothetical protein
VLVFQVVFEIMLYLYTCTIVPYGTMVPFGTRVPVGNVMSHGTHDHGTMVHVYHGAHVYRYVYHWYMLVFQVVFEIWPYHFGSVHVVVPMVPWYTCTMVPMVPWYTTIWYRTKLGTQYVRTMVPCTCKTIGTIGIVGTS